MLDCRTIYYKNGQKECEESDHGKEITKWYENGQKKSKQSEDWYGSKIITKWYEDGNKKYEESDRGRKFTKWYENGQKEHEESDRGGSIDKWYKDGTKKYTEHESRTGDVDITEWHANGTKKYVKFLKRGMITNSIREVSWDSRGRITSELESEDINESSFSWKTLSFSGSLIKNVVIVITAPFWIPIFLFFILLSWAIRFIEFILTDL